MELGTNESAKPCIYVVYNSIAPRKGGDGGADRAKTCKRFAEVTLLIPSIGELIGELIGKKL